MGDSSLLYLGYDESIIKKPGHEGFGKHECKFGRRVRYDTAVKLLEIMSNTILHVPIAAGMHVHVSCSDKSIEVDVDNLFLKCKEKAKKIAHMKRWGYCRHKRKIVKDIWGKEEWVYSRYGAMRPVANSISAGRYDYNRVEFRYFNSTKRLRSMIRNLNEARDLYLDNLCRYVSI